MYMYFQPFTDTEHYLLATEVAKYWRLYSKTGKPHSTLASAILRTYTKEMGLVPSFWYSERQLRMLAVYPARIYMPALAWFKEKIGDSNEGTISVEEKNYEFKLK